MIKTTHCTNRLPNSPKRTRTH